MPRKTTNKPTKAGLMKLTVLLSPEDMQAIDEVAEKESDSGPFGRKVTRTDVVKLWLKLGRAHYENERRKKEAKGK